MDLTGGLNRLTNSGEARVPYIWDKAEETGGKELYSVDDFAARGIDLKFIKTRLVNYEQFGGEFVPWLSIIDIMMFNVPDRIMGMFAAYDFC